MRAHANTVADGDVLDIRADTDGLADNLVADNAGWKKVKVSNRGGNEEWSYRRVVLTVRGLAPAGAEHVQLKARFVSTCPRSYGQQDNFLKCCTYVGAADTAVRHLDVDIVFRPLLGLELAPLHVPLNRLLVEAEPALKFVVGSHYV